MPLNLESFVPETGTAMADRATDEFSMQVLMEIILEKLSLPNLIGQITIVFLAILLGYFLARRAKMLIKLWLCEAERKTEKAIEEATGTSSFSRLHRTYWPRVRHFFACLVASISFSVISGCFVAMGAYAMTAMGFDRSTLILCRLAYTFLFAVACLSVLMQCLHEWVGEEKMTPGLVKTIKVFFWGLVILQFLGVLGPAIDFLDSTHLPFGKDVTIWKCIVAAFTVFITLWIANGLAGLLDALIMSQENFSANLRVAISRVTRIALFILAIIMALNAVGFDLAILSIFGGAVGVGLGFGLQKIASNYISGFIILMDKPVKIGDMVTVGGFKGKVTEINTRFTVVRSNDGLENIVPNESFVTSSVLNQSYTDEAAVQYIDVSVAYDADVPKALKILLEEGMRERSRIVKGRKGWSCIDSLGDSGINLKLAFWVADPKNGVAGLKTAIYLDILRRFKEEGIEIPYNMLELNIRKVEADLSKLQKAVNQPVMQPKEADALLGKDEPVKEAV